MGATAAGILWATSLGNTRAQGNMPSLIKALSLWVGVIPINIPLAKASHGQAQSQEVPHSVHDRGRKWVFLNILIYHIRRRGQRKKRSQGSPQLTSFLELHSIIFLILMIFQALERVPLICRVSSVSGLDRTNYKAWLLLFEECR